MKAQSDARDPEARGGDPASAQITDHHASPRNAMQLGDQAHGILPLEVMEMLRTQHDIDAQVGEGKLERVGAERVVQSMARRRRPRRRAISRARHGMSASPVPTSTSVATGWAPATGRGLRLAEPALP